MRACVRVCLCVLSTNEACGEGAGDAAYRLAAGKPRWLCTKPALLLLLLQCPASAKRPPSSSASWVGSRLGLGLRAGLRAGLVVGLTSPSASLPSESEPERWLSTDCATSLAARDARPLGGAWLGVGGGGIAPAEAEATPPPPPLLPPQLRRAPTRLKGRQEGAAKSASAEGDAGRRRAPRVSSVSSASEAALLEVELLTLRIGVRAGGGAGRPGL